VARRRAEAGREARAGAGASRGARGRAALGTPRARSLALGLGFAALALAVYAPALSGPFVSDDLHYVATNPYVHELSWRNLRDLLDPRSAATVLVVNYAPVQLLVHALEWQVFGEATTGYHVVNVLCHALASALLALLFARCGVPPAAAAVGGLWFLLHPANVEAVAWVSQLKSPASLALALGALLAHPRRPAAGAVLFGLALLAKPTAAFALPVAALLDWTLRGRVRARWLALWALALAAFAVAEFWTHQRSGAALPIHPDAWVRLRTSFAIGGRYLWMAATSSGVSAFHEPAPSLSWLEPWWLAGLAASLAIAARALHALVRRRAEAAFWAWAGASFVPVSQLFPFLHPMADRYLYAILPGLLGGVLLAGGGAWARRLVLAAALVAAALLGVHSLERARLWSSPLRLLADSAAHYPEGRTARLLAARRAAQLGDAATAVAELRVAFERGFNRFEQLQSDPAFDPIRGDPRFRALVREIASWWVERLAALSDATQIELRQLAVAQVAQGDRAAARRTLERALAREGPLAARIRDDLVQLGAAQPEGAPPPESDTNR
jgi:hypothetical protein